MFSFFYVSLPCGVIIRGSLQGGALQAERSKRL